MKYEGIYKIIAKEAKKRHFTMFLVPVELIIFSA